MLAQEYTTHACLIKLAMHEWFVFTLNLPATSVLLHSMVSEHDEQPEIHCMQLAGSSEEELGHKKRMRL